MSPMAAGIMLIIFGIIFLCVGVFLYVNTDKNKQNYRETVGTIVDIQYHYNHSNDSYDYDVYVDYTVNQTEYKYRHLNYYNSGMDIGDEVTITYDVNNPGSPISSAKSSFIISLVMALIGATLTSVGVVIIIKRVKTLKEIGNDISSSQSYNNFPNDNNYPHPPAI